MHGRTVCLVVDWIPWPQCGRIVRVPRIAHPLRFRRLTVLRTEMLTPGMRRVILGGADLAGFSTLAFDDHVKLFFPAAGAPLPTPIVVDNGLRFPEGEPRPEGRDFTPRRFDAERQELTIDFGLHGSGPATGWARSAQPGMVIGAGGPRGSDVWADSVPWHLLVGDETAVPAIARRIEEAPPGVRLLAVIEVDDQAEQLALPGHRDAQVTWVYRACAGGHAVDAAVAGLELPDGAGRAWVAGEAAMARRIRQHLLTERGLAAASVKAAAYWRRGGPSKHEIISE